MSVAESLVAGLQRSSRCEVRPSLKCGVGPDIGGSAFVSESLDRFHGGPRQRHKDKETCRS